MTTVNTKQTHYNDYYQCQTNALQWLANTKTKKKKNKKNQHANQGEVPCDQ